MRIIEWALDNLFVVIIIAGVIGQLLQAIRKKGRGDDSAPASDEQQRDYEFEDPELAERTRRIREDIKRRIAERQRGGSAPPPVPSEPAPAAYEEPPPIVREVVFEEPAPSRAPSPYENRRDHSAERAAEILEQQAALAERLRQADEMKAAALRRAAFEAKTVAPETRRRQERRGALVEELRSPDALRRAMVLREVLGPPVGLR